MVVVKASALSGLQRLLTARSLYGFSFGEFWRETPEEADGRGTAGQEILSHDFFCVSGCKKEPLDPSVIP